jgi:crossover junction endodeoxyribonuclease RuvC
MRIIGIDPGIGRMGWGVIDVVGAKTTAQRYGCIETSTKQEVPQRLLEIQESLVAIVTTYKPEILAIEELFFNTNATTAFIVGQARGIVLLTAAQYKLPVAIYTPLQVKMALTGYGRAEKNQIGQMVKTLLKLDKVPKPDDTADALAIALTHAFSHRVSSLI